MRDRVFGRGDVCRLAIIVPLWSAVFLLVPAAPFPIVWTSFLAQVFGVLVLVAIWAFYRFVRLDPRLATAGLVTAEVIVFSIGAALLNYLGFTFHRPFIESWLAAADAAMGFSWPGYVAWIQSFPAADGLLTFAYDTSMMLTFVIVIVLSLGGWGPELDRFVIAFMAGALITILFWIAYPSYGAFHYRVELGLPVPEHGLSVTVAYSHYLLGLKAGDFAPLRLGDFKGLVGFPSFHTALALIGTWAVWRIRFLGPVVAAINLAVLLAVPGDGGHYLIDMAGGVGVAVLAAAIASVLARPATVAAGARLSAAAQSAG